MGLLKILQKSIDCVGKVLAWLLIRMGLWLSVLYVVLFFVICALTDTTFTSVQNLFWTCLLISAVLGLWISLSLANKFKKKEKNDRAVANIPKVKRKNGKEDYEESRESYAGLVAQNNASAQMQPQTQPITTVFYTQPQPAVMAAPQYVQPTILQPLIQQPVVQPVLPPQTVYPPQYTQPAPQYVQPAQPAPTPQYPQQPQYQQQPQYLQ